MFHYLLFGLNNKGDISILEVKYHWCVPVSDTEIKSKYVKSVINISIYNDDISSLIIIKTPHPF